MYRDGPNSLSFSDPRSLAAIYGARANGEFRKAKWYTVFPQPGVGGSVVFVINDPEEHKIVKKRMKPLVSYAGYVEGEAALMVGQFTVQSFLQHEETVSSAVTNWANQLGKRGTVDLGLWTQYLTLDVSEFPAGLRSVSFN